jgi:hypothetical protein
MAGKFGRKAAKATQDKPQDDSVLGFKGGTNVFIRSKRDNKLMMDIQVKDLREICTPDCINVVDADSIAYKSASAVEDDYIFVVNTITKEEHEFKNITEFKGNLRTEGAIKEDSWLGGINLNREALGDEPYSLDDFTVEPRKRLRYEDGVTIDGLHFDDSLEVCKYYMDQWIHCIKEQTQIPNYLLVLGQGDNHRHDLPLPHQYKSSRADVLRPLVLKQARKHLLEAHPSEMAQIREEGVSRGTEADEKVDEYGFKGYRHYRKHGKFNYIRSAIDKDAHNSAGILFDYTKAFVFEYPQAWLIEHRDVYTGSLEMVKGKVKGSGLKHMCLQLIEGDSADEYSSKKYLPKDQKPAIKYGASAFYKQFLVLETAKDVLDALVDVYYRMFPEGVKYTSWDEKEMDIDTLTWLDLNFRCAYMHLKTDDPTRITTWLDQYKIDYSRIKNNHKPSSAPLLDEEGIRDHIEIMREQVKVAKRQSVAVKSEKKDLQITRLNNTEAEIEILLGMFEGFFGEGK